MTILRSNFAASSMAGPSSFLVWALLMPTDDPRFAGFTNTGYFNFPTSFSTFFGSFFPIAAQDRDVLHDGQSGGDEQRLHDVFVHAGGGAEDAGANVRNVGQFEKTLNRAVFAKCAVQHRKDHINVDGSIRGAAQVGQRHHEVAVHARPDLPIVKHVTILRSDWETDPKRVQKLVESKLKIPSVREASKPGIISRHLQSPHRQGTRPAIEEAAKFDRKIVIEAGSRRNKKKAREIEVLRARQRQTEPLSREKSSPSKSSTTTPPSISTKVRS